MKGLRRAACSIDHKGFLQTAPTTPSLRNLLALASFPAGLIWEQVSHSLRFSDLDLQGPEIPD